MRLNEANRFLKEYILESEIDILNDPDGSKARHQRFLNTRFGDLDVEKMKTLGRKAALGAAGVGVGILAARQLDKRFRDYLDRRECSKIKNNKDRIKCLKDIHDIK